MVHLGITGEDLVREMIPQSERRIVLVTDAYHMLRADACFRKESFTVIPAACGYRTYHDFQFSDWLPGWEPIAWNEDAVHESVGLVWYRLHGWI